MNIKSTSFSMLLFFASPSFSQQANITADSVRLELSIQSKEQAKLATTVNIVDVTKNQIRKVKSNKEGKATCVLPTGDNYVISIPESDDSYEYSIPDMSISPLALNFEFSIRDKNKSAVVLLQILNNPIIPQLEIQSPSDNIILKDVKSDSIYFEADKAETYHLNIKGVEIKNNSISVNIDTKQNNYLLIFTDKTHAELRILRK